MQAIGGKGADAGRGWAQQEARRRRTAFAEVQDGHGLAPG